jgi:hypothetical protein
LEQILFTESFTVTDVALCWRPYTAILLHSVCDQIENLYKIAGPPQDINLEGEGP